MDPPVIAIVDYGVGNLRSVERALLHVGAEPLITSDPGQLERASGIVLPGVGREVVELARNGKPVLGVCLGYQLLFEESEEGGRHEGLGLLPGRVVAVEGSEHVPVIGWCRVRQIAISPIWSGIPDGAYFYFVHSYGPAASESSVGAADHAPSAAACSDRVMGTQFHPEKSGPDGLRVYENFLGMCLA